jgi:hypothetical protein
MMSFEGRRRWRQQEPFKLRAKPGQRKKYRYYNGLLTMPELFAGRIRIQNLRFAHFLCGAQEMSGVIKR